MAFRQAFRQSLDRQYDGIPPAGKSIDVAGIDLVRIEAGKAVERWGVFDGPKLMQQLGQVPVG